MRNENQIHCSNCGTLLAIESQFCASCGYSQVEFPVNLNLNTSYATKSNNDNVNISSEVENPLDEFKNKSSKGKVYFLVFLSVIAVLFTISKFTSFLSFSSQNAINIEEDKGTSSSCNCSDIGYNKISKLSDRVASDFEMNQRNIGTSLDIQKMNMKKVSDCSWIVEYKIFDNLNQFQPPKYISKKFICLDNEAFEE